jgi:protein-disulfide isomerase
MSDPAGFRKISGGPSSSGFDPFFGLPLPSERSKFSTADDVRRDICSALYGRVDAISGAVPIASFSDYYCPYCRVQTKRLARLADELGADARVFWHELPLLGDTSMLAAKAALAAKRQGAYVEFHHRLLSSPFVATPEYLLALAESLGVDYNRLISDMESDDVMRELDTSAALSEVLGFIGTPAMVVGRTVIQGQISDHNLQQIIDLEREEGWAQVC